MVRADLKGAQGAVGTLAGAGRAHAIFMIEGTKLFLIVLCASYVAPACAPSSHVVRCRFLCDAKTKSF